MSKTVTLRLPEKTYERFRMLAERENRPLSNFIETAASRYVESEVSQADGQAALLHVNEEATVQSAPALTGSGYEAWNGTSMATPHVAGVAALIWSWNPSLTNDQIREALQITAMDLGDPGRDVYYGYGLVQAYDAWKYLGGGKPGKK